MTDDYQYCDDPTGEDTRMILSLALQTPPALEVVRGWTPQQREEAERWAGAVHLAASDNDDVTVPPRPSFL